MGRVPWDDIPDSAILPGGTYELQIDEMAEGTSQSGKLMYSVTFAVVEPKQLAGLNHWENYTIGTDDDPSADDPMTWKASVAARLMKRMLKSAQVQLSEDMEEVCAAAAGNHFVAVITQSVDDGSRDPKYKGRVRANIQSYHGLGEAEPGLAAGVASTAPKATKVAGKTVAPLPPKAAQAAEAPKVPAKPAAPRTPATVLKCVICKEMVPRTEYAQHVESHDG